MSVRRPAPARFNPFKPGFTEDPYTQYAELRYTNPVHKSMGMWVVTRYEDVLHILADRETNVDHVPRAIRELALKHELHDAQPAVTFAEKSIVFTNEPEHKRLRSSLAAFFAPARVAAWRSATRRICAQVIGNARADDTDMVALSEMMTDRVLGHLFALTEDEQSAVRRDTSILRVLLEPRAARETELKDAVGALARCLEVFSTAEHRLTCSDDGSDLKFDGHGDLLRGLKKLGSASGSITSAEADLMMVMVYVAGLETTSALIANAVFALAGDHALQHAVSRDKGLVETTVQETLRHEAPLQMTIRTATRDIPVAGDLVIGEGAAILLCIGSANRDETVFTDPDRFDPHRSAPKPHLGFGMGLHTCLGATLARMEAEEAIAALSSSYRIDLCPGEQVKWSAHTSILRVPAVLRVTMHDV